MMKRADRVAKEIKKIMGEIIQTEIKYKLEGFVTVTDVEITPNLQFCRVFFSIMGNTKDKKKNLDELIKLSPYIRKLVAEKLNIKYMPELSFKLDTSLEYAMHIDKILSRINKEKKTNGITTSGRSDQKA